MRGVSPVMACGLTAIVLAACTTMPASTPTPQKRIRQSVVTAPADLQLLCASQTASQFNLNKNDILPVDSQALSKRQFEVILRHDDGSYSCIIDRNARISNIAKIALSTS